MNPINSIQPINGAWESMQGGRAENQDFLGFADTPLGFLLVLCDGMGGGPGGLTASSTTVQNIINYVNSCPTGQNRRKILRKAIQLADESIIKLTTEHPQLKGMGTTCVIILLNSKSAMIAHVGDSRLYQFRGRELVFRTADHSYVGELVKAGTLTDEQARLSTQSNIITRAINGRGIAIPDIEELPYERGDYFMLCSDGIWGHFSQKDIIKKATESKSASGTAIKIAYDANEQGLLEGGNHDNLTIAVIRTEKDSKKPTTMNRKSKQIIAALSVILTLCIAGLIYIGSSRSGLQYEIQTLKTQVDSTNKASTEAQAKLKSLEERAKENQQALDKKSNAEQNLISENAVLKEKNKAFETENQKLRAEIQQLKAPKAAQQTPSSKNSATTTRSIQKPQPAGGSKQTQRK